jgi:hypothetical protein
MIYCVFFSHFLHFTFIAATEKNVCMLKKYASCHKFFYYVYMYFFRYLVEQGVHVNQQNKVYFFSSGNIIYSKDRI